MLPQDFRNNSGEVPRNSALLPGRLAELMRQLSIEHWQDVKGALYNMSND